MSAISGGATSGIVDNLSALLEFVKSPDYLDRIRELRDLEESSRNASDQAKIDVAAAEEKTSNLVIAQRVHNDRQAALTSDIAAHQKRVALWDRAMAEVQKALRGED